MKTPVHVPRGAHSLGSTCRAAMFHCCVHCSRVWGLSSQRFANPIVQWTLGVTVRMHGPHPSRIWNPVSKAVCWACQFSAGRMFCLTVQALGSKTRYSRGELLGSLTDFHVPANFLSFKSELLSSCFQGHCVLRKIHYKKPSASFSNKYNCSVFRLRGF